MPTSMGGAIEPPTAESTRPLSEMYCSKCGAPNAQGVAFCKKCGLQSGSSQDVDNHGQSPWNSALRVIRIPALKPGLLYTLLFFEGTTILHCYI